MTEVPTNVTTTTTTVPAGGYTPPDQSAVEVKGGWFPSDPLTDTSAVDTNNSRVQTYDRYASSNSGAFPSYFPQIVSRKDVRGHLNKFTPEEVVRLKQRLWAAGYLKRMDPDKDGVLKENVFTAPPIDAELDDATLIAFDNLTHDAATRQDDNGNPYTLDSLLNANIQGRSSLAREAVMSEYNLTAQAELVQTWAEKNIGRNLSDGEVQTLFAIVGASDTSFSNQTRSTTMPFGSPANDLAYESEPLTGGGADSKAINYLKNLSNVYGTTVVADFTSSQNAGIPAGLREGRGVIVGGNIDSLTRLKEWADSQKDNPDTVAGANPLFETVEFKYENGTDKDPTGLYLAVNELAQAPAMSGVSVNYQSFTDQTARFLNAIKRPGGDRAYNWEGNGVQRGAYGLSDEIWNYYTTNVFKNIAPDDHSAAAQDAVARAYAQDLFSGDQNFQNWNTVAIAFVRNEDAARSERDGRRNEGDTYRNPFLGDEERKRLQDIISKMSESSGLPAGMTGKDPYTMMYGESGLGVPTVSDPYAGRPRDENHYNDKLMRAARKEFAGEKAAASSFSKLIKILQGYDSSVMGGLE
jgi:hypothetical protein